jgi:aspartate/methionine/tyrosine aminotransferase
MIEHEQPARVSGSVYMRWAKDHAAAPYNLANSGLAGCTTEDLAPAPADILVNGPNHDGYAPLLAAIGERYGVQARQVITAPGTSGANFLAFATLVSPGDTVLVEQPAYEPLLAALSWLGARLRRFRRRFQQGWRWDAGELRAQLDGHVRLVVLTNPHNPSGVLASHDEVAEVARLAERAGAHLLVDEVYKDLWGDLAPLSHVHLGPHVLATGSLTKCYGLSGLRCGWVLGAPDVIARLRRLHDFMAATNSMPSDALALAAFRQLPRLAARARAIIDPNWNRMRDFLAEHRDWLDAVLPDRAMMIFPRLLREDDSTALHDRLRRLDTSIVPGRFFDAPRHFRLGFATVPADVAEGLRRLSQALRAPGAEAAPGDLTR